MLSSFSRLIIYCQAQNPWSTGTTGAGAPGAGPRPRPSPGTDLGGETPVGAVGRGDPAMFRVGRSVPHESVPRPHKRMVLLGLSQRKHHAQVGGRAKYLQRARTEQGRLMLGGSAHEHIIEAKQTC